MFVLHLFTSVYFVLHLNTFVYFCIPGTTLAYTVSIILPCHTLWVDVRFVLLVSYYLTLCDNSYTVGHCLPLNTLSFFSRQVCDVGGCRWMCDEKKRKKNKKNLRYMSVCVGATVTFTYLS